MDATDAALNTSGRVQSEPISTLEAVFADDFSAGLANWSTVTRISQDLAVGSESPPAR